MLFYRLPLLLLMTCLFATSSFAASKKHIAITTIVDHPSLNNIRQGIEDRLAKEGYIIGDDLVIEYKSAQGSSATAAQIAKQLALSDVDVIVPITTSTAQAIAAATKTIPIVFVGITDPISAKLIKHWGPSQTNITGISDALAIDPQIEFMLKINPNLKTVGYIYSPSEINSTAVLKKLRVALATHHIQLLAAPAQKTADVATAARSLTGKVDMIYTTTDNNVVSAYEALVKIAGASKIPLIASDPDSVKRGAAAALAIGYYQFGQHAGKLIARILRGEQPGTIAPSINNKSQLIINPRAAKKQGLMLNADLLKSADRLIHS